MHEDDNEDSDADKSLLNGDDVGMASKSNSTISVSKKQTQKQK